MESSRHTIQTVPGKRSAVSWTMFRSLGANILAVMFKIVCALALDLLTAAESATDCHWVPLMCS